MVHAFVQLCPNMAENKGKNLNVSLQHKDGGLSITLLGLWRNLCISPMATANGLVASMFCREIESWLPSVALQEVICFCTTDPESFILQHGTWFNSVLRDLEFWELRSINAKLQITSPLSLSWATSLLKQIRTSVFKRTCHLYHAASNSKDQMPI